MAHHRICSNNRLVDMASLTFDERDISTDEESCHCCDRGFIADLTDILPHVVWICSFVIGVFQLLRRSSDS
jgi:hypothetical protein